MEANWKKQDTDAPDRHEQRWEYAGKTVLASKYDTGDWVIRYGKDNNEPTKVYSRNVFSQRGAVKEAHACMRDLTNNAVPQADSP
jgi:hypothetical protein